MKQLNKYLEGLLSKSNKNTTRSTFDDQCSEYITNYFKTHSTRPNINCEVTGRTITIANNENPQNVCWGKMISGLISKYNIKKMILHGNWDLYVEAGISDFPIDLECDGRLTIGSSFTVKNSSTINNINIKVNYLYIAQKIKLNNSQILSDNVIEIRKPSQIAKCKTQIKQLVMDTLGFKSTLNSLIKTKVPDLKGDNVLCRRDWFTMDPERVKEIKNIDPIKTFGFNNLNAENIITGNIYSDSSVIVFTKNPKSHKPKYPDIYEMKSGWYALWLDSNDVKKQLKL